MSSDTVSLASVLLHRRKFQWYWNAATDPWSTETEGQWQEYTDVENEIIEDAHKANIFDVEIDGGYIVNLEFLLQYVKEDEFTVRPMKRIQLDRDRSSLYLREDRFSLPIRLATTFVEHELPDSWRNHWRNDKDISYIYDNAVLRWTDLTIPDVIEEAIQGIIKEGIILGKEHEARWLADQLQNVKHDANDSTYRFDIPPTIGQTLVYLYTKECFWYKQINRLLRALPAITDEEVKTIGPFCYLLHNYLEHQNGIPDISIVYRGVLLTVEQRQDFLKPLVTFTAFTSTSKNRDLAGIYGNSLLIIDLVRNRLDSPNHERIICGRDISNLSNFPEEEEFLIWPDTKFDFVKYQYDEIKKKHNIYLKLSIKNWKLSPKYLLQDMHNVQNVE